jgi:hypothetical protein
VSEEAKVKRYTTHVTGLLVVRPGARNTYNKNWTDVVSASDFDALARQLGEAQAELAKATGVSLLTKAKAETYDLALAERDALRASERRMREALEEAIEYDGGVRFLNYDDSIGDRACCNVVSYRPHQKDCWVLKARAALITPTDPHNDDSINQKDSK